MAERYAFQGTVEFDFAVEVAGHRVEKKGRIDYKLTPDGVYFDPVLKRDVEGSFEVEVALEVHDPDTGWEHASLSFFREHRDDGRMGAADEHLMNLIQADAMRQSEEARASVRS